MNKYINFSANPIKKFKFIKFGQFRVSIPLIIGILVLALIGILSTISITDAEATFVRNGDFKLGAAISANQMYEGDNFNVTLFLTNTSKITQLVVFQGACQATYKILDMNGKQVYPNSPENTPCNNRGYEEFLIFPQDIKRYYFSMVHKPQQAALLSPGKYQLIGVIDGFGETETKIINVLARPKVTVSEGELCEGLTGKKCDSNLECRYAGGFPGGAGMCFAKSNQFSPVNRCGSSNGKCFSDIENHPNKDVIEKYVLLNRVSGYDDGTFKPDESIRRENFIQLLNKSAGSKFSTEEYSQEFIQRDEAVAYLYKAYIRENPRNSLELDPYIDTADSKYQKFIQSAFNLGILYVNEDRKFNPYGNLTRAQTLILIDRFENFR